MNSSVFCIFTMIIIAVLGSLIRNPWPVSYLLQDHVRINLYSLIFSNISSEYWINGCEILLSIEVKILLVYKNNGIRSKLKVCMFGEGWMGGGADLSEIGGKDYGDGFVGRGGLDPLLDPTPTHSSEAYKRHCHTLYTISNLWLVKWFLSPFTIVWRSQFK